MASRPGREAKEHRLKAVLQLCHPISKAAWGHRALGMGDCEVRYTERISKIRDEKKDAQCVLHEGAHWNHLYINCKVKWQRSWHMALLHILVELISSVYIWHNGTVREFTVANMTHNRWLTYSVGPGLRHHFLISFVIPCEGIFLGEGWLWFWFVWLAGVFWDRVAYCVLQASLEFTG